MIFGVFGFPEAWGLLFPFGLGLRPPRSARGPEGGAEAPGFWEAENAKNHGESPISAKKTTEGPSKLACNVTKFMLRKIKIQLPPTGTISGDFGPPAKIPEIFPPGKFLRNFPGGKFPRKYPGKFLRSFPGGNFSRIFQGGSCSKTFSSGEDP